MTEAVGIQQIRASNPFPWKQAIYPNGIVRILDANNNEVPLFAITELACVATAVMSQKGNANESDKPD